MRHVALVTGASSGIGFAASERLIECGYSVVATARRKERMDSLQGDALVLPGDICDPKHCREIVRRADDWGSFEVLVANAMPPRLP